MGYGAASDEREGEDVVFWDGLTLDDIRQIKTVSLVEAKHTNTLCDTYNWIVMFYVTYERMPSRREMCKGLKIKHIGTLMYRLRILRAYGWLDWLPNKALAIRLMRPTERGLSPRQLRKLIEAWMFFEPQWRD